MTYGDDGLSEMLDALDGHPLLQGCEMVCMELDDPIPYTLWGNLAYVKIFKLVMEYNVDWVFKLFRGMHFRLDIKELLFHNSEYLFTRMVCEIKTTTDKGIVPVRLPEPREGFLREHIEHVMKYSACLETMQHALSMTHWSDFGMYGLTDCLQKPPVISMGSLEFALNLMHTWQKGYDTLYSSEASYSTLMAQLWELDSCGQRHHHRTNEVAACAKETGSRGKNGSNGTTYDLMDVVISREVHVQVECHVLDSKTIRHPAWTSQMKDPNIFILYPYFPYYYNDPYRNMLCIFVAQMYFLHGPAILPYFFTQKAEFASYLRHHINTDLEFSQLVCLHAHQKIMGLLPGEFYDMEQSMYFDTDKMNLRVPAVRNSFVDLVYGRNMEDQGEMKKLCHAYHKVASFHCVDISLGIGFMEPYSEIKIASVMCDISDQMMEELWNQSEETHQSETTKPAKKSKKKKKNKKKTSKKTSVEKPHLVDTTTDTITETITENPFYMLDDTPHINEERQETHEEPEPEPEPEPELEGTYHTDVVVPVPECMEWNSWTHAWYDDIYAILQRARHHHLPDFLVQECVC
jgi:hypothetical protein